MTHIGPAVSRLFSRSKHSLLVSFVGNEFLYRHYIKRFLTRDKQNNKADELDGQRNWDSSSLSPDKLTHVDLVVCCLIFVFCCVSFH